MINIGGLLKLRKAHKGGHRGVLWLLRTSFSLRASPVYCQEKVCLVTSRHTDNQMLSCGNWLSCRVRYHNLFSHQALVWWTNTRRDQGAGVFMLHYYPPEVSSMKYCCLAVFRNTSGSSLTSANRKITLTYWYSWVVKIRNTSEAALGPQYTLGHHTDCGPMGLGQYNSLGEYCGPHTASSVFLILIFPMPHLGNA